MNKVVQLRDWPTPSSVPSPIVIADDTRLLLRYITTDSHVAVIKFPLVDTFQFGFPNDEALGGHPLAKRGLQFYSVHRVENSTWIDELERRNSVHPRHSKADFMKDRVHYIFTFQDSTLECVVVEGKLWKPEINVYISEEEANRIWNEATSV